MILRLIFHNRIGHAQRELATVLRQKVAVDALERVNWPVGEQAEEFAVGGEGCHARDALELGSALSSGDEITHTAGFTHVESMQRTFARTVGWRGPMPQAGSPQRLTDFVIKNDLYGYCRMRR